MWKIVFIFRRQKEQEEKRIEEETQRRVEAIVKKRIEEEIEKRRPEIEAEVRIVHCKYIHTSIFFRPIFSTNLVICE